MNTTLRRDEHVIKEGTANLQRNIETVGGWLRLTDKRLVLESHRFNVQRGVTEIELSRIQASRACWTRLLGVVPLFNNSVAVITTQGKEYRFVVHDRRAWVAAIEAQRHGSHPAP